MPGRHPDDDLLADLAADVLPAGQARVVEAHVLSCDRCAGLLEDAERVRSLLLSGDPGPLPADVWHRIEATLAAEAVRARTDASRDTAAFRAFADAPAAPGRVVPLHSDSPADSDAPADALDDADPLDDPARWDGPRARGGSAIGGSRRDARARSRLGRGALLLAAAAVVAVVALVGSVKLLARNTWVEASLSGGASQGSASASAPGGGAGGTTRALIVRTGRDYRASTLAKDASALLAAATGGGASGSSATAGSTGRGAASPQVAAPGVSKVPAARVPTDASATDITNPARLAGCLSALNVAPGRLVAVDLATYEGREAAILLVSSADGTGHEIWAVDRRCAPGSEGAITYKQLSD